MPIESFTISADTKAKFKEYCDEHRANRSRVMRYCLESLLDENIVFVDAKEYAELQKLKASN